MDPACDQQVLRDDTTKNCLRIIEEFARFFANLRVVENTRITAAQFPRMEKRRPIDERNQVFKFRYTRADADEFRFRRDVTAQSMRVRFSRASASVSNFLARAFAACC